VIVDKDCSSQALRRPVFKREGYLMSKEKVFSIVRELNTNEIERVAGGSLTSEDCCKNPTITGSGTSEDPWRADCDN
jgi:hypothetical protein